MRILISRNVCVTAACAAILCACLSAPAAAQSESNESNSAQTSSEQSNSPQTDSEQVIAAKKVERKAYSDKISEAYNYRFGKDRPFMPGNANTEDGDFVQPGAFPRPGPTHIKSPVI